MPSKVKRRPNDGNSYQVRNLITLSYLAHFDLNFHFRYPKSLCREIQHDQSRLQVGLSLYLELKKRVCSLTHFLLLICVE